MEQKKTMILDGAFGTYYYQTYGDDHPCELANIQYPDRVTAIHTAYLQAGCEAVKTNTYGVNHLQYESKEKRFQLVEAGYKLAEQAASSFNAPIFCDIGFINDDDELAGKEYLELADCFLTLGGKNFLFETLADYSPIEAALYHIKASCPDSTVLVSFAVSQDGFTKRGKHYRDLFTQASVNKAVTAIGLNCLCGPTHMLSLMKTAPITNKKRIAMPNSGYPSSIGGRMVFQNNPDYFAEKLTDMAALGIEYLGGCCGTTPEHLRKSVAKIKDSPNLTSVKPVVKSAFSQPKTEQTIFKQKKTNHQKIIAVELDSPINNDCSFILEAARDFKLIGADFITVADSPLSRARADSIMTAAKIKREIGIDVIPHLACRDRNHIATKASLLAASFEDIRNIFVITGDPVIQTDHGKSGGVFTFNSFTLISYLKRLNQEVFSNVPMAIGAALNINSPNFDIELKRAEKKLELGANFLMTQPIFSEQAVQNLITARKLLDCTLLAGILPVASYKNALFLTNEVSGIEIPDEIMQRFYEKTPEECNQISLEYSLSIMDKLQTYCDGFYLMVPLKRTIIVSELIREIRKRERQE